VGAECGTIDNGCGGQLACGICTGMRLCVDNGCIKLASVPGTGNP
jgi:hypothetical protein